MSVAEEPTSAPLRKAKVPETPQQRIQRCRRLLSDERLVERLPDKGQRIRRELSEAEAEAEALVIRETQKREEAFLAKAVPQQASGSSGGSTTVPLVERCVCGELHEKPTTGASLCSCASSKGVDPAVAEETVKKYGDNKLDVQAELRKVFGSQLSDREIDRLAEGAASSFLSFNETVAFEQHEVDRERNKLLSQLYSACHPDESVPERYRVV